MLVIGYFSGRNQDEEGYNIYGRKLPKWGYIASYSATYIGAGFFIAGTGYAYMYGAGLIWLFVGLIFGITVFGFFAKWLKEKTKDAGLHTLPDFFKWRFGKKAALVLTVISLLLLVSDISIQLISGGKLLQALGVMDYSFSVLITVFVVAFYLIFSGFRAVIWTDYVLMSAIILLTIILAFFTGKFFKPSPEQLNLFSVPISSVIGFFLFGLLLPFTVSTYYQRIFAAKSADVAKKGTWFSGLAILIPGLLLLVIGGAAKNQFPNIDPDLAFLNIIKESGPSVALVGALLLWAALMSTVDTLTFAGSQMLNKNLLNRSLTKRNVGFGIVILLMFGLIVSFTIPSVMDVGMLFVAGGLTIAPSAFFQWFMKDLKQYSVISSLVIGMLTLISWAVLKGVSLNVITISFFVSTIVLLVVHFVGKVYSSIKK